LISGSRRSLLAQALAIGALIAGAGVLAPLTSARSAAAPPAEDAAAVEKVVETTCEACHGDGLAGGDRAPALVNSPHLRTMTNDQIKAIIKNGTPGGMPPFPLADKQLDGLAAYLRARNQSAVQTAPVAQVKAGERFFFGEGGCAQCHMVAGLGGTNGPDLTAVAARSTMDEIQKMLDDPTSQMGAKSTATCPGWAFCPDFQWVVADVRLRKGGTLRGFARFEGEHALVLQTFDGKFHSLTQKDYLSVRHEPRSYMPPLHATAEQRRDLLAYLSSLAGTPIGPLTRGAPPTPAAIAAVMSPKPGEWPTYDGALKGNRYSPLAQISTANVRALEPQWSFTPGGQGLENTPLVMDGVMYVTGAAKVCALDAATGHQIWCTPRTAPPALRSAPPTERRRSSAPAPVGPNRGVAILGNQVFFTTDDAYLVSLNRVTGAPVWAISLPDPEFTGRYYTSAAPLVVGDLVITGIAGGDTPLRGFLAAYHADTGKLAWRLWTIPRPGEPLSETWKGRALPTGGGATWTSGSYDKETGLLYWTVGNPYPATNGDEREGSNLYTGSVLALDPRSGAVKWYFQFSPHDLHDWDANEPLVLADATIDGRPRKLLMQANRNGFFYVLDRVTGAFIYAKPFVRKLTWASGVGPDGKPQLLPNNFPTVEGVRTCPSVRGATNWYASAYNPGTGLFYVMAAEDCSIYRKVGSGYSGDHDVKDPSRRYLRAIDVATGKIAWEKPLSGSQEANYTGVLTTAGGLVFHGETGGAFAAVDARTGKTLWIFRANANWRAPPMTYTLKGRQYVAVAAGANILSFALGKDPSTLFGAGGRTAAR
jgi:PQQ-dependent dehydrogenase (methanol/ethanol family)